MCIIKDKAQTPTYLWSPCDPVVFIKCRELDQLPSSLLPFLPFLSMLRWSPGPQACQISALLVSYRLLTCSHLWLKFYLFIAIETQPWMLDCLVKALHPSLALLDPCLGGNAVCAQSYDPCECTLVSLSCPLRPLPPTWANSLEYIWYFYIIRAFPITI